MPSHLYSKTDRQSVPSDESVHKMRRVCASQATSADDLRQLLAALGIGPEWKSGQQLGSRIPSLT